MTKKSTHYKQVAYKYLLSLICLYITLFLVVFLVFNMRHDEMVLIRRRIKKFQYELLKEYIDRKDSSNWKALSREISLRKVDVNSEIEVEENKNNVVVYFDETYAPIKNVSSIMEESMLDCIAYSLLDNLDFCKEIYFRSSNEE